MWLNIYDCCLCGGANWNATLSPKWNYTEWQWRKVSAGWMRAMRGLVRQNLLASGPLDAPFVWAMLTRGLQLQLIALCADETDSPLGVWVCGWLCTTSAAVVVVVVSVCLTDWQLQTSCISAQMFACALHECDAKWICQAVRVGAQWI